MNERIRELALEAGIASRKYSFGQYWEGNLTEEQIRFAELIVRECAKIAADQGVIKPEYRIRKHFGVE